MGQAKGMLHGLSGLFAMCLMLCSGGVQAAPCYQSEPAADDLDSIFLNGPASQITVASFREQLEEEAPASVLLITSNEIISGGARTVGEALERHAGLYLSNPEHLLVRGIGSVNPIGGVGNGGRILLLINGVRANDVFTDSFTVGLSRGVYDIDHIEVIKGPASALFGTSAYAGIINIVTVTGEDCPGGEARLRTMSPGSQSLDWRAGFHNQESDLSGSLSGRGEVHLMDNQHKALGLGELRGNGQWRALNFVAGYSNSRVAPLGDGGAADDGGGPPGNGDTEGTEPQGKDNPEEASSEDPVSNSELRSLVQEQAFYAALEAEHTFQPWLSGYLRVSTTSAEVEDLVRELWVSERRGGVEGRALLRFRNAVHLTGGFELRREQALVVAENTEGVLVERQLGRNVMGVYSQVEVGPFIGSTLTAGVRAERSSNQGPDSDSPFISYDQISPRISLVSQLGTSTVLKLMGGYAYELPSLSLLYHDNVVQDYVLLANSELSPETLTSAELQVLQEVGMGANLTVSVFYQQIDGMIAPMKNQDSIYKYQNALYGNSGGVEAEGALSLGQQGSLFGNVTVLRTHYEKPDSVADSEFILLVPPDWLPQVTVGTNWTTTSRGQLWLSASYNPNYQHPNGGQDSESMGNLRIDARTAIPLGERFEMALAVRNLLNSLGYQVANGRTSSGPGTEVWLEVSMKPRGGFN